MYCSSGKCVIRSRYSTASIRSSATATLAGCSGGKPKRSNDASLQPLLRAPVRLKLSQFFERAHSILQVCFAGILEQSTKSVLGSARVANQNGVLCD